MSDLVRRDDLWAAFQQMDEPTRKNVRDMIRDAEAVDAVEVEHSEWKWSHGGECGACGFHNSNFVYRFCPMCGAKMDGRENDA